MEAAAFEDSDFPVPGIPTRSIPLGRGRLSFSGKNALALLEMNSFRVLSPPHLLDTHGFPELQQA